MKNNKSNKQTVVKKISLKNKKKLKKEIPIKEKIDLNKTKKSGSKKKYKKEIVHASVQYQAIKKISKSIKIIKGIY